MSEGPISPGSGPPHGGPPPSRNAPSRRGAAPPPRGTIPASPVSLPPIPLPSAAAPRWGFSLGFWIGLGLGLIGLFLAAAVGGLVAWSLYHGLQVAQAERRIQAWADVADGIPPKEPEPSLADWTLVYQIPAEPPKVGKNAAAPAAAVPDRARFGKVVKFVNLALLSAPLKELPSRDGGAGWLMPLVELAERLQTGAASLEDLAAIGVPGKDLIGDGQPVSPSLQEFLVKQGPQQGAAVIDRIRQGQATLDDYGLFVGVGQLDATAKERLNESYQEVGKKKLRLSSIEDCTASLLRARDKTATVADLEKLGVPFAGFQAAGDTPAAGFQQHFWAEGAAAAREVLAKVREGKAAKDDWVMLKGDGVTDDNVKQWNASITKQREANKGGGKTAITLAGITGEPSGGRDPTKSQPMPVPPGGPPPGAEEKAWQKFAVKAVVRATWGRVVSLASGIDGRSLEIDGVKVTDESGSSSVSCTSTTDKATGRVTKWEVWLSDPDHKQAGTVTLKDDSLVFERAADGPDIS